MTTRHTTLDGFYKAVDGLIESLAASNCMDDSRCLNGILHQTAWTTSSELMGELALAFKNMRGKYPPEIKREIDECREFAVRHRKILGLS